MVEWNRTTPWRQGHLLSQEAADVLELQMADSPEQTAVVVVSHDCDLASSPSREPEVEAIRGHFIDGPDGNFVHAKNARTLHIPFTGQGDKHWIELPATEKLRITKTNLVPFAPRTDLLLDHSSRSTLQRWLAARYRRAAFPDEFEKRLKENGLDKKLVSILKPRGEHIRAIFFDVDEGEETTRIDPDDAYTLTILVLYSTESDPAQAQSAAEKAKGEIESAFREKLFLPAQRWKYIELVECIAVADEALTYRQSTLLNQWNLDHLSLRENPPQPTF